MMFKRKKPAQTFDEIVSFDGYTVKPIKGKCAWIGLQKSRDEERQNGDLLHLQDVRSHEGGQGFHWRDVMVTASKSLH
jgi:hypothetical protein